MALGANSFSNNLKDVARTILYEMTFFYMFLKGLKYTCYPEVIKLKLDESANQKTLVNVVSIFDTELSESDISDIIIKHVKIHSKIKETSKNNYIVELLETLKNNEWIDLISKMTT